LISFTARSWRAITSAHQHLRVVHPSTCTRSFRFLFSLPPPIIALASFLPCPFYFSLDAEVGNFSHSVRDQHKPDIRFWYK
jgi:hypothetical protein